MSEHNGTPGSVPADIRTNPPAVMTGDEVVALLTKVVGAAAQVPEIMTTRQLAEQLDTSRATISRMVRLGLIGYIPGVANGHLFRWSHVVEDLTKLERRNTRVRSNRRGGGRGGLADAQA